MDKTIGKTKETGWQFGVRKTVSIALNEVWDFMFSEIGVEIWLKEANMEFSTFKHHSHLRTKWKLKEWPNEAILQMRLISGNDKTTVAFHIEKLLDEKQRVETKIYWDKVIKTITEQITTN